MNLHQLVAPYISSVNPFVPCGLHISIGPGPTQPNGTRPPLYAAPGSFTGSIAGSVLTISAIASGRPQAGQTLTGGTIPLLPQTTIGGQLTGSPGGIGTYAVSQDQAAASQQISTAATIMAQIQPLTMPELRQLDGLNLGGDKLGLYTNGDLNGVIRVQLKGGDLVDLPNGTRWLVVQSIEGWDLTAGWSKVAMVIQA